MDSLTYSERQELSSNLRRRILNGAYDDRTKMALLDAVDPYARWGPDLVRGLCSEETWEVFSELLQQATSGSRGLSEVET